MSEGLERLAALIERAHYGIALTGAGASTESGIPDFRGRGGLWAEADPMRFASLRGFLDDPRGFYAFWGEHFGPMRDACPSAAHRFLVELEARGRMQAVITQNIDGLHVLAGSRRVFEVHGRMGSATCLRCGVVHPTMGLLDRVSRGEAPSCERCAHGYVKPDVVLFGEPLPPIFAQAQAELERADLLLVLGSSLEVHPVCDLVPRAHAAGIPVAMINRDPGPHDALAEVLVHAELGPSLGTLSSLLGVG
ncbi:MAG: Sir2 family NAD-dependent protein deacetylase [Myxococcales bacterium]|nr:Sir2 family NAD-dependent protein deacetylase [Myxococcales bacterium]